MLGIALAAARQSDYPLGEKLANDQPGIAIGKCGNGLVIGTAHGRRQFGSERSQARSELDNFRHKRLLPSIDGWLCRKYFPTAAFRRRALKYAAIDCFFSVC